MKKIISEIKNAKTFLIVGHANPEGDAIGSCLALGLGLETLKKKVKIFNADPVPQILKFLPQQEKITSELSKSEQYDIVFIVDVGEIERTGDAFKNYKNYKKLICLDHHSVGKHEGDFNYVLPEASATGVLVYYLLKELGLKKLSSDIATNLFCAISTDTGSFRYSNTNAEALKICSELLKLGVDPWKIAKNCYETFSIPRIELLKKVLQTLTVHPSGRIASIDISLSDLKSCGASVDLTEGFINYARSVEGVEVAVSFREKGPNKYKMGFRSNKYVDVAALAQQFGGGGHERAAGCNLEGSLDEVKKKIFKAVLKVL